VRVEVKVVEVIDPIKLPLKGIIQLLLEKKNLNDIIALSNNVIQAKNSPQVERKVISQIFKNVLGSSRKRSLSSRYSKTIDQQK
jgi:hypothetical protein